MQAATHIGTSGWQYQHWKGLFYPVDLKIQDWLAYYSQHFDCVEINSSFYGMPKTDAISRWCSCVPPESNCRPGGDAICAAWKAF
jgi:uncharacterized protein YecE (DUF72 family)